MMMKQRQFFNILYAVLIVVLCSIHGVESKRDKKTKEPTIAPSFAPSTSYPSALPSSSPTLWPSAEPTKRPTLRPTTSPTGPPTRPPTASPSGPPSIPPSNPPSNPPTGPPTSPPTELPTSAQSALPTATLTGLPTSKLTELPTSIPTWDSSQSPSTTRGTTSTAQPASTKEVNNTPSPTNHPSEPANGLDIPVPRIQMSLILSEEDMDNSSASIQDYMSSFITVLLETKTGVEAVDMVSLALDIVPSTFMRRNIESGFSIKIEGMMQSTHGIATKEILRERVAEYFKSSGINDLETFLHGKSITSASIGELYVDGFVVFLYKKDDNTAAASRNKSEVPVTRTGLFAILMGAVNVLLVTCSIYFYRRKYGNGYSSLRAKPRQTTSTSEEHHTDSESQNSGRDISVNLSMHELEPDPLHRVDSYQEYDATRLDRIISDAKSHGKKKSSGSNALHAKR